ncbi:MAG: HAD-IA family hydrolase [Alphaproteobacteria bacterium]|nr:HAD-IA family hydrolase [Alphaproteobacteria bacterium]
MKTVIFDLDGTLADTSGDLVAAANACFRGLGHGNLIDPVADQEVAFNGGRAMLALGFSRLGTAWSEADIDAQIDNLLAAYEANIDTHTVLYEGVVPALERLAADGYGLGVCTNKPAYLAEILLKRLNIRHHFGAMLGVGSLPVRKPDPELLFATIRELGGAPERSVLIGDTITDRKTAENAGVPSILVTFGPKSRDVVAMKPDGLLDHYDDLFGLLKTMQI